MQENSLKIFYKCISVAIFVLLIFRFAQLQLYNWDKYFHESEKNRIREIVIDPPRGLIYDRFGEILVDNRPAYAVSVVPYEFLKSDSSVNLLSSILEQAPASLKQKIKKDRSGNFTPVKIKRQVEFKIVVGLKENVDRDKIIDKYCHISCKNFRLDYSIFDYNGGIKNEKYSSIFNHHSPCGKFALFPRHHQ